jgi:chromosome segregation protein
MYLKSLNIVGFKTFADETEIIFDPGFTAVVGPNGSGKSNIVDAMKWVLGEKSAKGLRGDKMDDVIFHGSENRDPSGFAEVTVTLDNSAKVFAIDFPLVKITRRVYPDLTNEYLINNVKSLRKDVEKLLLDTGVGKSTYSIMEQGRVEGILNAKPEERRAIFDEAAGISRYKLDKAETEKKLEFTKQNLLRITDIMSSMEKELDLKFKQAERTKNYFDLKDKYKDIDKNIRYLKWKSYKSRLKKLETEQAEIKEKNDKLIERMNHDSQLIEKREKEKYDLESKIAEIDKKLFDFLSQKEIQKEKIENNKNIIQEYVLRIEENLTTLEEEKSKYESSQTQILDLKEDLNQYTNSISDTKSSIETFMQNKKESEEGIETEINHIKLYQNKILENDKKHSILREQLKESISSLMNQIEEKKREVESSETIRLSLKNELYNSLDEFINKSNDSTYKWDANHFKLKLKELLQMEDGFRDILLDKEGLLAKKENIDSEIEDLILENENVTRKISESNQNIEYLRIKLEEYKEEIVKLEKSILEIEGKFYSTELNLEREEKQFKETESKILSIQNSIQSLKDKKSTYELEVQKLEEQIEKSYNEFLGMSKILESEKEGLKKVLSEIQELKNSSQADQEEFRSIIPLMNEYERKTASIKVQMETFLEELYNDYSISDVELEAEKVNSNLKQEQEESKLRDIKSEMQLLGSINPLAIDEYNSVKEIYEHHEKQKKDIEDSKNAILDAIKNINSESEKVFLESFEIIRNNFQETFSILFNGGKATIELTEKEDILNSGVEIIAEPPGKHVQNLKLLSGGEKSMTVIALLFAIYMLKPSPFCFLDEIDAALDEVNKIRFCQILDKFKNTSQFVVVTHAPPTISRANTIFGVTSSEPGVSKVVSLRIDEAKNFAKKIEKAS